MTLGALGGWVLWTLHSPLPWLLGSMIASALAALLGAPVATPAAARPPMSALLGAMIGASFGANTFARAGEWLLPLTVLAVFLAVGSLVGYAILRRLGGLDRPTAFFAGMPGGLVDMVLIGRDYGGDERIIALAQAARIFFVVLSLPFLLQLVTGQAIPRAAAVSVPFDAITVSQALWFVATYCVGLGLAYAIRMPARFMIIPLLVSAAVHLSGLSDFVPPSALVAAAQVIIGAVIGCRFVGVEKRAGLRAVGLSLAATSALLVVAFLFAGLATWLFELPFVSLVLAYSPGGLAEMSLIALALNGEVAFVLVHHLLRVALVIAVAPLLFRAFGSRSRA